jgi:hypothetical protein
MQEYNSNTFKILICSDNDGVIHSVNQKIAESLKNIPYELKIVKDGVRAINELGKSFCQLFISDSNPVGIDVHYLLKHYQEVSGGGSVIVLKHTDSHDRIFENCEVVNWPISAWNEFEEYVKNAIPEELKIKYGLGKVIPLKFQSLNELVQKYKDNTISYNSESALVIMPSTFFERKGADSVHEEEKKVSEEKIMLIGENNKKFSFVVEILFFITILALNIYVLKNSDFESESFFSVRVLLTSLTGFVFFVLAANWTLRRYIIKFAR